jgi:hypothetical protein
MSKVNRRVKKRRNEVAAMQILEEAFHLIRTTDAASFWKYYLGAVPWSVGLLYFVADMGRSSLAERDAALAAAVLTGLYFWMRICEARFCSLLWARLDPGGIPKATRAERFRAHAALALCQSVQLPLLVVGLFFAIPLGWILATQRNFAVLAFTMPPSRRPLRDLAGTSIRYAHDQWAQNHGILILFFVISLVPLVNIVASCLFVPGLLKSFFGIESVFTLSPQAAVLNTTFVIGVVLLMQLVICPLMNAAYVLRCFYARSRTTAADLLGRLGQAREVRREELRREGGARVAALLVALGVLSATFSVEGAPIGESGSGTSVEVERFREEIDATLEQKKYQWQISRRSLEAGEDAGETWLGQRLNELAASIRELLEKVEKWMEESIKRLFERGGGMPAGESDGKNFQGLSSTVSVALVVVILGLLVWLAITLYRRHQGREKEADDDGEKATVIDLASEDIVATQLHEDEWLRLAREQIEKGEERLAIRALFLATLAHLGERGLLKIARFKSNRDYRGELLLRARSLGELRRAFDENTGLFERSWYGMHRLAEGALDFYLKNHALIGEESARAVAGSNRTAATQ